MGYDLVIVANRLPVDRVEQPDGSARPGGPPPAAWSRAIEPVMRANDGVWIGWPGGTDAGPRAVRGRRPRAGPGGDDRRGDRGVLRGLLQRAPCGRSTTTWSPSRSSTASGGTPTSRSTSGSPTRPPSSPTRARWSGCTTTSCSWCRRCCASCGPTCGSASTCTSRSRRPSCSSSCRGGARSSRGCSAPTWSASSCPGGAANFVRLVRQRVGHKTHRDLVYLPDGRTVRARGVPDLDRHRRLRGAGPVTRGVDRARQGDPRARSATRARSSSASTGSTTPRASTPGCAPSAS